MAANDKSLLARGKSMSADTTNIMVVVVVLIAGILSVVLLTRTARAANRINDKAENIARTGQGINTATDSVIQLNRTNEVAGSILASAKPLEDKLDQVVTKAQSVNALAATIDESALAINGTGATINKTATGINDNATKINKSAKTIGSTATAINTTAGQINTTAGSVQASAASINGSATKINGSAKNINTQVAAILNVGKRINDDVAQINRNLDTTIGHANGVKVATTAIVSQAKNADRYAKCIDARVSTPGAACPS